MAPANNGRVDMNTGGVGRHAIFAVAVAFAAVAVAGGFYLYSPPKVLPSMELRFWIPSPVAIAAQAEADARRKEKVQLGEEERSVFRALTAYHHVEVQRTGKGANEELRGSLTYLEQLARSYYGMHGREMYRGLGLHFADQFEQALRLFLLDVQAGRVALVEGHMPSEHASAQALHGLGGSILGEAFRTGLVGRRGDMTSEAQMIVRFHYLVRWARLLREIIPQSALMSRMEELTLLKWKVEAHTQLSLSARVKYAQRVQYLDSAYPVHQVLGILYWKANLLEEAVAEFALASSSQSDNLVLQATEQFVREQLKNSVTRE